MPGNFDAGAIPCPWGSAPTLVAEQALYELGYPAVAGIDEVGRGCLAGPVIAAAVILPNDAEIAHDLYAVRDSKQLTAARRRQLAEIIQQRALAWGIGQVEVRVIESQNILRATRQAMRVAMLSLNPAPNALLIDAVRLPDCELPQVPLIKGDQRSLSIAAASILAKVARDQHMVDLDARYPGYGFARHKGYGTAEHLAALRRLGPCAEHRRTFAPIKALVIPPPIQASFLSLESEAD